jgi:hypothetical protein
MMSSMAKRSDDDRLRYFDALVADILAEPAMAGPWAGHIEFNPGSSATATIEEPRRQDLRSLLMDVRKMDAPSEDAYLPDVLALIRGRATDPEWRDGLDAAARELDAAAGVGSVHFEDPTTHSMLSGRDAFRVWIYGEHLHNDVAKQARWDAYRWAHPIARQIAVEYMQTMLTVAAYCRAAIANDPGLSSVRP